MILLDERTDLTPKEWLSATTRTKVDVMNRDFFQRVSETYRKPAFRNILPLSQQEVESLNGQQSYREPNNA